VKGEEIREGREGDFTDNFIIWPEFVMMMQLANN
jgi:hypothetical protein